MLSSGQGQCQFNKSYDVQCLKEVMWHVSSVNLDVGHDVNGFYHLALFDRKKTKFSQGKKVLLHAGKSFNFKTLKFRKSRHVSDAEWPRKFGGAISLFIGGKERPEISFEYMASPIGVML